MPGVLRRWANWDDRTKHEIAPLLCPAYPSHASPCSMSVGTLPGITLHAHACLYVASQTVESMKAIQASTLQNLQDQGEQMVRIERDMDKVLSCRQLATHACMFSVSIACGKAVKCYLNICSPVPALLANSPTCRRRAIEASLVVCADRQTAVAMCVLPLRFLNTCSTRSTCPMFVFVVLACRLART